MTDLGNGRGYMGSHLAGASNDTIAAFATPIAPTDGIGGGAIGVVRMSGPDAFRIAAHIFRGKKPFEKIKPYTIGYGYIFEHAPASGGHDRVVDEVLILKMNAPRSYTREDVVEIHCHAGAEVQRRILRLILNSGARAAAPGEFTKRAFLNGRIDLSQAEAVMDIIKAKGEIGAATAMRQLDGALSKKLGAARKQLIDLVASLEAFLDFPEHEIEEQSILEIDGSLNAIAHMLRRLGESFEFGRIAREGATAVIAGRPNVGKSTLLNLFADYERAIVTEIPGTTRDVIEEYKNIGGFTVRFLDTAGIRETDDVIENMGIARTLGAIEKADIALLLFSADEGFCGGDARLVEITRGIKRIFIINKIDLVQPGAIKEMRGAIKEVHGAIKEVYGEMHDTIINGEMHDGSIIVEASLINGEGFDEIVESIRSVFFGSSQAQADYGDAVLTNARHNALVSSAQEAIVAARATLGAGMPLEIPIIDMRDALAAIGEITGETYSEEIIDRIFSEFCVGK